VAFYSTSVALLEKELEVIKAALGGKAISTDFIDILLRNLKTTWEHSSRTNLKAVRFQYLPLANIAR